MTWRKVTSVLLFLATIPAANYMVANVGTFCDGPCLVPVWLWPVIYAPSGVLLAGLALVLRDWVHEELGPMVTLAAILAGATISTTVAPVPLAVASGVAFLLSELADFAVYSNLRRRGLTAAVLGSSVVGSVVDSVVFLAIAFGSLEYLAGQVIGKFEVVALAVLWLNVWRARPRRRAPPGQRVLICTTCKLDLLTHESVTCLRKDCPALDNRCRVFGGKIAS